MCFSLSCKVNARVKLAKTGHGPHSTTLVVFVLFGCYLCCSVVICVERLLFVLCGCYLCCSVVICVVRLLFMLLGGYLCFSVVIVLFSVLFVCKCVLPPGDNPIAVNKYININIILYNRTDVAFGTFGGWSWRSCSWYIRKRGLSRYSDSLRTWTIQGSIPGACKLSVTVQTGPRLPTQPLTQSIPCLFRG